MIQICALVGSLRATSHNRRLVEAFASAVKGKAEVQVFGQLGELPLFNPDIKVENEPEVVRALKHAVGSSDGILIATPEYNYSIPGVLKNAIDWMSRPPATSVLRHKPTGIMGAAAGLSGSIRAQLHLRQILHYSETNVMQRPEMFLPKSHEQLDANGVLHQEPTAKALEEFANALVVWIERHVR
ncbi:MAG: NAD(P)H-dependent oxidoreductase [Polyangiaceae bacterium]|nr:NAD(P)H-dependent oxidoreductase [Polyangiaceae bacterium]